MTNPGFMNPLNQFGHVLSGRQKKGIAITFFKASSFFRKHVTIMGANFGTRVFFENAQSLNAGLTKCNFIWHDQNLLQDLLTIKWISSDFFL